MADRPKAPLESPTCAGRVARLLKHELKRRGSFSPVQGQKVSYVWKGRRQNQGEGENTLYANLKKKPNETGPRQDSQT